MRSGSSDRSSSWAARVIVVAVLTVSGGRTVDPDDVRRHCRAHLAAYMVPETVEVIAEMPVNASGKIIKRELRRRGPDARS